VPSKNKKANSTCPREWFCEAQEEDRDERLDIFIVGRYPDLSRSRVQNLTKQGLILVNGQKVKASYKVKPGDRVLISLPPPAPCEIVPEAIPLNIVYEDESILVINKPPGLVVHPAPGHPSGTLVHGLLYHCKDLKGIGGIERPGIVHRLDKDTTGLMVVAKDDMAHETLVRQFKKGSVKKHYLALVHGNMPLASGRIESFIGRHPKNRKKMAVLKDRGKSAITIWQRRRSLGYEFDLLDIQLETGRTHQIRVHLSYIGHPIVGDQTYGYGKNWWKRTKFFSKFNIPPPGRQMLHSSRLLLKHPKTGDDMEFVAELPKDMAQLLVELSQALEETA